MAKFVGFDERSVRRIGKAVRWVEDQETRGGDGVPGGRYLYDGSVPIYNASGSTIPEGGVVWATDYNDTHHAHSVEQPDYPGIAGRLMVCTAALPDGELGRAWVDGVRRVLCDEDGITPGDRIGAQGGSFVADHDLLGPMTIIEQAPADEQPANMPANTVIVHARITADRGNTIMVRGCLESTAGPCLTLRLSAGWTVTEEQPGVLLLGIA